MLVLDIDREALMQLASAAFGGRAISAMEVGVLRGDNAMNILNFFNICELHLVDSWSTEAFSDYHDVNRDRPWVRPLTDYSNYFGGSVNDQVTLDRLYYGVCERFKDTPGISIHRMESKQAILALSKDMSNSLDYLYLDGSHQFETVFDDLMGFTQLLKGSGFLQLNDVAVSKEGIKQNLGVLEAMSRFIRISDFMVLAITNRDCSDCLLSRRQSPLARNFLNEVERARIKFVEVPGSLVSCARIIGVSESISFS